MAIKLGEGKFKVEKQEPVQVEAQVVPMDENNNPVKVTVNLPPQEQPKAEEPQKKGGWKGWKAGLQNLNNAMTGKNEEGIATIGDKAIPVNPKAPEIKSETAPGQFFEGMQKGWSTDTGTSGEDNSMVSSFRRGVTSIPNRVVANVTNWMSPSDEDYEVAKAEVALHETQGGNPNDAKYLQNKKLIADKEHAQKVVSELNALDETPENASGWDKLAEAGGMIGGDPLLPLSIGGGPVAMGLKLGAIGAGDTAFRVASKDMPFEDKAIATAIGGGAGLAGGLVIGGLSKYFANKAGRTGQQATEQATRETGSAVDDVSRLADDVSDDILDAESRSLDTQLGVLRGRADDVADDAVEQTARQADEVTPLNDDVPPVFDDVVEDTTRLADDVAPTPSDDLVEQMNREAQDFRAAGIRAETEIAESVMSPYASAVQDAVRTTTGKGKGKVLAQRLTSEGGEEYLTILQKRAAGMVDTLASKAAEAETAAKFVRPAEGILQSDPKSQLVQQVADLTDDIGFKKTMYAKLRRGKAEDGDVGLAVQELQRLVDREAMIAQERAVLNQNIREATNEIDEALKVMPPKRQWGEPDNTYFPPTTRPDVPRPTPTTRSAELLTRYGSPRMVNMGVGGIGGASTGDEDGTVADRALRTVIGMGLMYGGYKGIQKLYKKGLPPFKSLKSKMGYTNSVQPDGEVIRVAKPLQKAVDDLGQFIHNKKLKMETDYMTALDDLLLANAQVDAAIATVRKMLNKLSVAERELLHNALVGEGNLSALSPEIQRVANQFRTAIDDLGEQAVRAGLLDKEAFDVWKGSYLHRLYESHLIDASKGQGSKTLKRGFARGKTETVSYRQYQDMERTGQIGQNIREGKWIVDGEGMRRKTLDFAKKMDDETDWDTPTIRLRKDYTFDERTAMGEIRDAAVTIPYTLHSLKQMLNLSDFLKQIKASGVAKNFDGRLEYEGYKALNGYRYGALNGMQVPKAVAEDLEIQTAFLNADERALADLWKNALGLWKRSKTVYNPGSHINNVIGNWSLMVSQGVPMHTALVRMAGATGKLAKYSRWVDLNGKVRVGKATAQEIALERQLYANAGVREVIEAQQAGLFGGMRIQDILQGADNVKPTAWQKPFVFGQNLYMSEDNMGRLAFYGWLRKNAGLSADEAVKETRGIIPDYRLPMSKAGRILRDTGLDPFFSWTYHTLPAVIKASNPLGTTKYGKGLNKFNAYNIVKLSAALWGGSSLFSILNGGEPTTPFLIPTERPRNMQFTTQDIINNVNNDGTITSMGMNYMLPQLGLISAVVGPLYKWFGEGSFTPVSDIGDSLKSHLTLGIPGTAIGALLNRHPYTGFKISEEEGLWNLVDYAGYLGGSLLPTPPWVQKTGRNVLNALTRDDSETVIKNPSLVQSIFQVVGPRTYKWDPQRYHYSQLEEKDRNRISRGIRALFGGE